MLLRNFIIILTFSFFNYCCYSYYEIKDADPVKGGLSGVTKVELKNKKVIKLDDQEFIEYGTDTTIVVKQGLNEESFSLSEISKVYETRFDFVKTFFFSAGILFAGIFITALILSSHFKM